VIAQIFYQAQRFLSYHVNKEKETRDKTVIMVFFCADNAMLLAGPPPPLAAVNASGHIVHAAPPTFDGAPIILAPRLPVPMGHPPPPPPSSQPVPSTSLPPPPSAMPAAQPSLVPFGDLPPAPLFAVHFDPFLASQTPPMHHAAAQSPVLQQANMPNIAYVR